VAGDAGRHRGCRLPRLQRFPACAHVVYVGRYHPDFQTVIDRVGSTEVAERWASALEGVVTTITDADGRNYRATEIYHQD